MAEFQESNLTLSPEEQVLRENELEAARAGNAIRAQQEQEAAAQMQAEKAANPALFQQQAQQAADTMESNLLKGTGIAPGFKSIAPQLSPVAPAAPGLPATVQAPVEEIQAQEVAKATRDAAAEEANKIIQKEQVAKEVKVQQEVAQKNAETEKQVVADLNNSGSNFFRSIGDTLAIMLGAYSQGLTGNKENPGLKAVEARIEREVQQRKYNAEQEAALHKAAVDAANLRLEQMKKQTDNAKTLMDINKLQMEMSQLGKNAQLGQEVTALVNTPALTQAQLDALSLKGKEGAEVAKKYIPLYGQPGKYVRSSLEGEDLSTFRKYVAEVSNVPTIIKRFKDIVNSPEYSSMSPGDRKKIEPIMVGLVGQLRLPFTGPGPLLEEEYKRLQNAIGRPGDAIVIKEWEFGKLDEVERIINDAIRSAYNFRANVNLPNPDYEQDKRFTIASQAERDAARRRAIEKKSKK